METGGCKFEANLGYIGVSVSKQTKTKHKRKQRKGEKKVNNPPVDGRGEKIALEGRCQPNFGSHRGAEPEDSDSHREGPLCEMAEAVVRGQGSQVSECQEGSEVNYQQFRTTWEGFRREGLTQSV